MGIEFGKGGGKLFDDEEKSYVGLTACPVCGKDTGVAINRRLHRTFKYSDRVPLYCKECEDFLAAGGLWVIEVKEDTKEGEKNPYRTGYLVGLSKEFRERNGITYQIAYMKESQLKELMGDQYKKEIS